MDKKWIYEFAILFVAVISISGICEFNFMNGKSKMEEGVNTKNKSHVLPASGKRTEADSVYDFQGLNKIIPLIHPGFVMDAKAGGK